MDCYPGQPALQQSVVEGTREKGYDIRTVEGEDKGVTIFEGDAVHLKSHSTQAIVKWLEDTYQYEEGICLPRSTIYEHYTDFCRCGQLLPVNAASFGKIIRQQFPTLTTRRLGTRGQSKYHYYGLGIKPTSRYYTEEYLQRQSQGVAKKEPEAKKTHAYYATKEKPSAVLPKFPDVKNLIPLESIPKEKLQTFMVMYRAHCQRILDSVVRANFDEVENFLLHFWQGMPSHLVSVLGNDLVVDLVAVCDMILYKAIISVFITTPLQNIPDNVAQEVRRFSNNLRFWLESALKGLPESLTNVKFKVAEMFCKSLKRQRSLMHLADATRNAFKGEESLEQLESDWAGLNLHTVLAQTLYAIQPLSIPQRYLDMVPNFLAEFSCMFADERCSVEDFAMWIESVMDNSLKDVKKGSIKTGGKTFLLSWKFFTSKIVREFTLMSAPSFGTFHLLHMLVDDYIVHTLENMLEKEQEECHMERINVLKQEDIIEDIHVEDRLSSSSNSINLHPVAPPPNHSLSSTQDYTQFVVAQTGSNFKHPLSAKDHTSPSNTTPMIVGGGGGGGGEGGGAIGGGGAVVSVDSHKSEFSSNLAPQTFHSQDSNLMGGLSMQLEPPLQGMGHSSGMAPESTSGSSETFRSLLNSTDNDELHSEQTLGLRYSMANSLSVNLEGRSLSHPNLTNIPSRTLPRVSQSSSNILTHSQASIPFPANFGSFALSSMVGHLSSHPQLQPQSFSMNPAGGLMQGLGVSMAGGTNQSQPPAISNNPAQSLSLSNAPVSGLLGGGSNPSSISIMNPSVSLGGGSSRPNLPPTCTLPMPLTHPIAGNLQNPAGLPLITGMQNVYSYPYTATLPAQPITSSMIRPGFPSQSLVPGYPQYIPPSIYGNSQQPPVSTGNFSR